MYLFHADYIFNNINNWCYAHIISGLVLNIFLEASKTKSARGFILIILCIKFTARIIYIV